MYVSQKVRKNSKFFGFIVISELRFRVRGWQRSWRVAMEVRASDGVWMRSNCGVGVEGGRFGEFGE